MKYEYKFLFSLEFVVKKNLLVWGTLVHYKQTKANKKIRKVAVSRVLQLRHHSLLEKM